MQAVPTTNCLGLFFSDSGSVVQNIVFSHAQCYFSTTKLEFGENGENPMGH